jgi:hypothetical protein
MKERHWTSLVTSLRHGQCVLMLGQEVSAAPGDGAAVVSRNNESFAEALMRQLADELEEDSRRVIGDSLAAVAQQYEDAAGFGTNALRARAEKFYNSGALAPSALHRGLASLPFGLIVTTCHDDLMVRALKEAGKSPLAYRYHMRGDKRDNPEFVLSGSASAPVVYHLFGNAREPGSLVLSENARLRLLGSGGRSETMAIRKSSRSSRMSTGFTRMSPSQNSAVLKNDHSDNCRSFCTEPACGGRAPRREGVARRPRSRARSCRGLTAHKQRPCGWLGSGR